MKSHRADRLFLEDMLESRQRRSNVEWPQIIGLRNRIVHEYFGVDTEIVWEIITHDLTGLSSELHSLLQRLPDD